MPCSAFFDRSASSGEINHNDQINVTLNAPTHTKLCLEECMANGFTVLENVGTTGHPIYKAKYQFDTAGTIATWTT